MERATASPTPSPTTSLPTCSMVPAPSCPRTRGKEPGNVSVRHSEIGVTQVHSRDLDEDLVGTDVVEDKILEPKGFIDAVQNGRAYRSSHHHHPISSLREH